MLRRSAGVLSHTHLVVTATKQHRTVPSSVFAPLSVRVLPLWVQHTPGCRSADAQLTNDDARQLPTILCPSLTLSYSNPFLSPSPPSVTLAASLAVLSLHPFIHTSTHLPTASPSLPPLSCMPPFSFSPPLSVLHSVSFTNPLTVTPRT